MKKKKKDFVVTVNGKRYEISVEEGKSKALRPSKKRPNHAAPSAEPNIHAGESQMLTAPMPGTILDVKVAVGDRVAKGTILLVLEAMKMENELPSQCDGVVAAILVKKGSSVSNGEPLLEIAAP